MTKIIENKELKDKQRNLKALKILIEQYIKHDKKRTLEKIKKEQ